MSWLNFNDSINNIRGQLTTLANTVLADENAEQVDVQQLRDLCSKQIDEIKQLKLLNEELSHRKVGSDGLHDAQTTSWTWSTEESKTDQTKTDETITNLKKKITDLEREKRDLVTTIDQLDLDYQQNTEQLVGINEKLKQENEELRNQQTDLNVKYKKLLQNEEICQVKLKELHSKYDEIIKQTSVVTDGNFYQAKHEKLSNDYQLLNTENSALKEELAEAQNTNTALEKLLTDIDASTKVKLQEMQTRFDQTETENKALKIALQSTKKELIEYEKKLQNDTETDQKLAKLLQGYEERVSELKNELELAQNRKEEEQSILSQEILNLKDDNTKLSNSIDEVHEKYTSILTQGLKLLNENNLFEIDNICKSEDIKVVEFGEQVKNIFKVLLDLKNKCAYLHNQVCSITEEKSELITEKNNEIAKLMENSEELSEELGAKTQTIRELEDECSELMKNNDLLITELDVYKNRGLQTISESNEDLEGQLEDANKKIDDLEKSLSDFDKLKEHSSLECKDDSPLEDYQELLTKFDRLQEEHELLKSELTKNNETFDSIRKEKEVLKTTLERTKSDLETAEYQYAELNINVEALTEELQCQKLLVDDLNSANKDLKLQITELQTINDNLLNELNLVKQKLLTETENRKKLEEEMTNFTGKLQNSKMLETGLKLQVDSLNKDLYSLNENQNTLQQSLDAMNDQLERAKHDLHNHQINNEVLRKENLSLKEKNSYLEIAQSDMGNLDDADGNTAVINQLQTKLSQLEDKVRSVEDENESLKEDLSQLQNVKQEYSDAVQKYSNLEHQFQEVANSRAELITTVQEKHKESVTYYSEVQRFAQLLNAESEKCANLQSQVTSLTEELKNKSSTDVNMEEYEKVVDQNGFLKEKCEILTKNLLDEQTKVKQLTADQATAVEKETSLLKKLQRLEAHLLEVEDHYVQELLQAEKTNAALQSQISESEQREKDSSTKYTSVSIRANQQVESLQEQLILVTAQREELRKRISDMEDEDGKKSAALANLQFVLEQCQKERENDILKETNRIRMQITAGQNLQKQLQEEITSLKSQLNESKEGLQAALRLSDQLEHTKQQNLSLKEEVFQLNKKLSQNEDRIKEMSSQTDGKIDKSLIKSLIIGFISSNNNYNKDQFQILKIIATVLDFNQQDHDKVHLNDHNQDSWLHQLLHPNPGHNSEGFSQAFVKFLEKESKPMLVPNLLNNNSTETEDPKKPPSVRSSPVVLSEIVLPTFSDFSQSRSSSSILKDVLKDNS